MYGFEAGNGDAYDVVTPFLDATYAQWWFHGMIDQPPEAGNFMELVSIFTCSFFQLSEAVKGRREEKGENTSR